MLAQGDSFAVIDKIANELPLYFQFRFWPHLTHSALYILCLPTVGTGSSAALPCWQRYVKTFSVVPASSSPLPTIVEAFAIGNDLSNNALLNHWGKDGPSHPNNPSNEVMTGSIVEMVLLTLFLPKSSLKREISCAVYIPTYSKI